MKEQIVQKEIDYVRGKVAGNEVHDNDENVIVARGQTITDEIINRARQAGQLHYLMIAAVSSVVGAGGSTVRERLKAFRDITEGHEADFVRGETVGRDVTDFQGNILIRSGETVTDDMISRAEKSGLLQELVLAVGAPGINVDEESMEAA